MTTQNNSDAMRAVNLKIYAGLGIAACGLMAVGAISNSVNKAIDTIPQSTMSGIVTSLPVMAVSMCGFGAMGFIGACGLVMAWRTPRATQRQQRDDEPVIVASPRPAQIATSPIRQLPAPMMPTEPRYAAWRGDIVNAVQREQQRAQYAETPDNGPIESENATYSSDYGHPVPQYADEPQTPTYAPQGPEMGQNATNQRIIARLGDGQEINISSAAWIAFVSLDKPNREQWRQQLQTTGNSAPNADYSKCKTIAESYRLLNGAGCWISPRMRDTITQWLTQSE